MKVYQALFNDGEILECDSFKAMYYHAMLHCRIDLHWDDSCPVICRLCLVEYTDEVRLNEYGYFQHDLINRQELAMLAVSRTGFTIEYGHGVYEYNKEV